mmetsp:Transcript_65031/g.116965  ORF Transcript_65031/g.116965 Transcript_65031/m.116965 type:complete len:262 (+) Transcript_65031:319-1104(+)
MTSPSPTVVSWSSRAARSICSGSFSSMCAVRRPFDSGISLMVDTPPNVRKTIFRWASVQLGGKPFTWRYVSPCSGSPPAGSEVNDTRGRDPESSAGAICTQNFSSSKGALPPAPLFSFAVRMSTPWSAVTAFCASLGSWKMAFVRTASPGELMTLGSPVSCPKVARSFLTLLPISARAAAVVHDLGKLRMSSVDACEAAGAVLSSTPPRAEVPAAAMADFRMAVGRLVAMVTVLFSSHVYPGAVYVILRSIMPPPPRKHKA